MAIPLWVSLAILQFFVLGVFTLYMVRHYASKNAPRFSLIIVFISWYLGFFGTLFLPIDIAEAYHSLLYQNVTNTTDTNVTTHSYSLTETLSPSPSPIIVDENDIISSSLSESATESLSFSATFTMTTTVSLTFTESESPSSTPVLSPTTTATGTSAVTGTRSSTSSNSPTGTLSQSSSQTQTASQTSTRTPTTSRTTSGTPSGTATPTRARVSPSKTPSNLPDDCEGACGRRLVDENEEFESMPSPSDFLYSNWRKNRVDSTFVNRRLQTDPPADEEGEELPSESALPEPSPSPSSKFADWAIEVTQLRSGPMEILWFIVYGLTFILSFIIIPVAQDYIIAGEFTHNGKLSYAIRTNMVFYAILGGVAFFALIYVIFGLGATVWELFPIVISIANTYGLIIIVLLLGYGTAEVPLWFKRRAFVKDELRALYFRASDVMAVAEDSADELGDLLNDARKFGRSLMQLSQDKNFGDMPVVKEMVQNMEVVKEKMREAIEILGPNHPATTQDANRARQVARNRPAHEIDDDDDDDLGFTRSLGPVSSLFSRGDKKYKGITPKKLAKLHKQFNICIAKVLRHRYRNEELLTRCLELEFLAQKKVPTVPRKCKTAEGRTFYAVPAGTLTPSTNPKAAATVQQLPWGGRVPDGILRENEEVISEKAAQALHSMMVLPGWFGGVINRVYWRTRIAYGKYVCLFMWVFLELFSLAVLWSEVTIWVNLSGLVQENLSLFGIILRELDQREGDNYFSIQLASFIILLYMCICTTFTTFKLRLFDDMELSGNRNTHPYNFLHNSAFFNRLQFSLAFNFLNVCMHSKNKTDFPDTAFLHSVGRRMALKKIDWYLPILALVVYISCKFNFFYKILRKLGLEEKGEPQKGNREHENIIQQGKHVARLGQARLGLNDSGMSQEHIEMQIELSKSRMDIILARMRARQEGRDPDEVAPDPFSSTNDTSRLVPGAGTVDTTPIYADSKSAIVDHSAVKVNEMQGEPNSEPGATKKKGLMALAAKSTTAKASQVLSSGRNVFGLKRENMSEENASTVAQPVPQSKSSLFSMFGTGLTGTTNSSAGANNDLYAAPKSNFNANFGANLPISTTTTLAPTTPYTQPTSLAEALRGVPRSTSTSNDPSIQSSNAALNGVPHSQDFGLGRPTIPSTRFPK